MIDAATKKRLGQYFSGNKVADLLVRLCSLTGQECVIDPMAGIGDMIASAIELGISPKNVSGIEIDYNAGNQCRNRIGSKKICIGDAFSPESYSGLNRMAWDLVITNPPYVRYQSMNDFEKDGIRLKSAKEIRQCLGQLIDGVSHLDSNEKACFRRIIQNYSGLSDLAVPAWILCAVLTETGGRIAMVVPESWLNRDYALSIRYMLLKFFDIEYIVEDSSSVWFPNALVKTNLLVAKRVKYRENFDQIHDSAYKHIGLSAELIGKHSLVDKLLLDGRVGYMALDTLINSSNDISGEGFEVKNINLRAFLSEMSTSQAYSKLIQKLEPHTKIMSERSLPIELLKIMNDRISPTKLADLSSWEFQVGQGLRTGANKFFYSEFSKSNGDLDYLITDKLFDNKIVPVLQKYALPALRYQSDANGEIVITESMLSHRLLYIQEDLYDKKCQLRDNKNKPLVRHIAKAERTPIESNGQVTYFPQLSAVKPNIRNSGLLGGRRDWFMLPTLTNRHIPELCLSRVNYKNARCYLIADSGIVVDANFSTFWSVTGDEKRKYAMFALLNSTWVQSYLEAISTVMGGGALKIEASHIRNLLFPLPTDELIVSLSCLGKRLADETISNNEQTLFEIDYTVMKSLINGTDIHDKCVIMQKYLQTKVDRRQR